MKPNLGRRIKRLRSGLGLSLYDLSEATGLSKNHIWMIERGKTSNPTIQTLCALAKALKVSAEDLAFESIRDHGLPLSIAACDRLRATY